MALEPIGNDMFERIRALPTPLACASIGVVAINPATNILYLRKPSQIPDYNSARVVQLHACDTAMSSPNFHRTRKFPYSGRYFCIPGVSLTQAYTVKACFNMSNHIFKIFTSVQSVCKLFSTDYERSFSMFVLLLFASVGGLSEGYGHGGSGVCLGDGQTEAYLNDMDMTGPASAWVMARRRPI